jgi:hypothetical protein
MSQIIALAGFSGSGKSSSLKYLDPETTFIISCTPKQLSIPGFRKNYKKLNKDGENYYGNWYFSNKFASVSKVAKIVNSKMPEIKTLVIDDVNYLLSDETFSKAEEKGYEKFTILAKNYYDFVLMTMTLRDDLTVVFISHLVNDGTDIDPEIRLFTTGKMLTSKVNIDGLFNYIIYAEKHESPDGESVEYKFRTQGGMHDTCRCTAGCFKEKYIEPNMKLVIDTINEFENGEDL